LGYSGLGRVHWLHLTPKRLKWPERFFKRHGAKAVFIARFIALFPPVAANLLAGMAKMPWRTYLFYNLTGSAAYTASYILIGYFFGKKWKRLEAWLGPTALYLILAGIVLLVLGVIFRHSISKFLVRLWASKRERN
jgi:membrane protein DedA with SNARE-associated domain